MLSVHGAVRIEHSHPDVLVGLSSLQCVSACMPQQNVLVSSTPHVAQLAVSSAIPAAMIQYYSMAKQHSSLPHCAFKPDTQPSCWSTIAAYGVVMYDLSHVCLTGC